MIVVIILSALLLPIIWVAVKYGFGVADRYLPSPLRVVQSVTTLRPSLAVHSSFTLFRFVVGTFAGIATGVGLGLALHRWRGLERMLLPSIQAIRAVPAVAIVPFFIMWFGFSEVGKFLLVITGIAFNVSISALQILRVTPERYEVFFRSFDLPPQKLTRAYALPMVLGNLLPTVRFSLAIALGLVVVAEFLGAQVGLGYLIQTSKATFSMHVVVLATLVLGVMNVTVDWLTQLGWGKIVFWR